jgi:hypothetical protein
MTFKWFIFVTLLLLSCESRTPSENNLLDHRYKYTMFDFFQKEYDIVYDGTNFSIDMITRQTEDTLVFTMKEHNFPLGINVSFHEIRFEMNDFIELPRLIDLGVAFDYSIENSEELHQSHDIEGIVVQYQLQDDDEEVWTYIDYRDMKSLLSEVRPIKFRASIHVYSGLPEYDRNRPYINTAILKVTEIRLFGRK